jgi:hypothetical protein
VNGELTVVDRIRKQESALEQAAEFTDAFNPLSFVSVAQLKRVIKRFGNKVL